MDTIPTFEIVARQLWDTENGTSTATIRVDRATHVQIKGDPDTVRHLIMLIEGASEQFVSA